MTQTRFGSAASAVLVFLGMAQAATAASLTHEQELEAKVRVLEERLRRVESLVVRSDPGKRPVRARSSRMLSPRQHRDVPSEVASGQERGPETSNQPASSVGSPQPDVGDAENGPQELAVLRQNSVTLKPQRFEISTEASYVSRHSNLQTDRALLSSTSLRYGVADWLELSATVPFGYTNRTTSLGPGFSVSRQVDGVGDLLFQANARVFEQSLNLPGVVFSLGLIAPTGSSPYNFRHYKLDSVGAAPTPNPRNPLADFYSTGAWGTRTNLQFYKTVDPLILFFGGGIDYLLPERISGYTIESGLRFNYNFGLSFAVSEKTTVGFAVNGSYAQSLQVNGRSVFQSSGEPIIARLTIIQRVFKNFYLEPSVAFGLNQDAPDVTMGLGLRAQF